MGSKLSPPGSPRTGAGTNMTLPSRSASIVEMDGANAPGEAAHRAIESPRSQPAPNGDFTEYFEGSRPESVPAPPSPLLLQPVQPCMDGPLFCEVDTMALQPSLGSEAVATTPNANNQITDLSPQYSLKGPESREATEYALHEHILAVSSQLTSIPETVEEDILVDAETSVPQQLLATHSPIPESSRLPDEKNPTEAATSLVSPESPISPGQSSSTLSPATASSALDTQLVAPSTSSSPSPPDPQLVPEDTGDVSSAASTNGETSSIFDGEYHSDTSSYTASLLSDVKDYTYENGRRYHSYREGHYVLPNDDQEQDRQDLLHHVRNLVLNGALFRAPLGQNVQRVLDIGTGTGIWAIDFADTYPSAEVIGTDLSPIQPSWVPPNLRFLVDDAESPWLFSASRPFDFIHARDLGGAVANWPRLLRQAYGHLRPGGWVELQEFEVTLRSDDDSLCLAPMLREFLGRLHEASEAFHRPMNIAEGHRQRLVEAGFEDVRDEVYKVPSSAWSRDPIQKQIGRYNLCSLLMAVESYSLALFTRVLGWPNNETQVFLAGVRRDLKNPNVHTYCNLHIVYGRKPSYDC